MKKLLLLLVIGLFSACSIKFSGSSIPPEMKTVNVLFFENNATLVVPTMSTNFTEALKNMIRNQTRLNITTNDPDAVFSGSITNFDIRPATIVDANNSGVGNTSPLNRLTIRVNVKYTDNLNPKMSFEEPIERYIDYATAGGNATQLEAENIKKVMDLITTDIFNRAFANW